MVLVLVVVVGGGIVVVVVVVIAGFVIIVVVGIWNDVGRSYISLYGLIMCLYSLLWSDKRGVVHRAWRGAHTLLRLGSETISNEAPAYYPPT